MEIVRFFAWVLCSWHTSYDISMAMVPCLYWSTTRKERGITELKELCTRDWQTLLITNTINQFGWGRMYSLLLEDDDVYCTKFEFYSVAELTNFQIVCTITNYTFTRRVRNSVVLGFSFHHAVWLKVSGMPIQLFYVLFL